MMRAYAGGRQGNMAAFFDQYWPMLRRNPPVFTVEEDAMTGVRTLLVRHLRDVFGAPGPGVSAR